MNAESVGKGQYFGIRKVLVSVRAGFNCMQENSSFGEQQRGNALTKIQSQNPWAVV